MNHHAELANLQWLYNRLVARYNNGNTVITLDFLHRLEAELVQMQLDTISL
jgi:hypothetical protein